MVADLGKQDCLSAMVSAFCGCLGIVSGMMKVVALGSRFTVQGMAKFFLDQDAVQLWSNVTVALMTIALTLIEVIEQAEKYSLVTQHFGNMLWPVCNSSRS